MSLAVAIQMDPIELIDIAADSTFAMALEAQARGHALWHYEPRDLSLRGGRVTAHAHPLKVQAEKGRHFTFGERVKLDLAGVDVVLMRQDPPFDMAYIAATHMLEHVQPGTLVVNDPAAVRNAPEKLFATRFAELMPETLVTRHVEDVRAFRREFGDIIIKPLFGAGGHGVFRVQPGDENLSTILEMFAQISSEPLMIQRYLPEIRQGDKRILLIEGEPVGAVARLPGEGEARANFHAGGRAEASRLTERDRVICHTIGETLRTQGLIFVGIDVIGDYLTEINVTSPTGIHEINRLDDVRIEAQFWDAVEARLDGRPARMAHA